MTLLPFALASAAAAPSEELLLIEGQGEEAELVEATGRVLPTDEALRLLGMPEEAETWAHHDRTRRELSVLCWVAAGVSLSAAVAAPSDDPPDARLLLTPALVGTGLLVRHGWPATRHLGGWIGEEPLSAAVARHNAGVLEARGLGGPDGATPGDAGGQPLATEELARVVEQEHAWRERSLSLSPRGVPLDARGEPLRMGDLVEVLPPTVAAQRYREVRLLDRSLGFSLVVGGGVLAAGGGVVAVGGVIARLASDFSGEPSAEAEHIMEGGFVTMGAGGALAAVGGTYLGTRRHFREDPTRWYTDEELHGLIEAYDVQLRQEVGMPVSRLRMQPILGPGLIGVQGTF